MVSGGEIRMGTTTVQTEADRAAEMGFLASGSSVEAFFTDSVILVTGATGFLGKALLEKLLRSCPRLAMICVLMRPKRGLGVEQRFKALVDDPVFDLIRGDIPNVFNKLFPVKGDVSLPHLGLSNEDRSMLVQRVNIVFHVAATVRFNEPLSVAINLNTKGTDRMVELCKSMKNLVSVIHVSTAYCNANRNEIKEAVYATKVKPYTVIDMCDNLDEDTMKAIEEKLLENHPNTYTFTKNLAEQIILTEGSDLPITIVRPSIVCAALKEPFPGWIDNHYGVTGILMEIGRGTARSIMCNPDLIVDIVPVDYVIHTLICASWHNVTMPSNTVRIYNCTSSALNPVRWGEVGRLVRKYAIESPTKHVLWYPGVMFTTNKFLHNIVVAALHYLPAILVDLILRFQGAKPTMVKTTKRIERAIKTGEFFATHEWTFYRQNMDELEKYVQDSLDADTFQLDITSFDWDTYMRNYVLGIRKYILKDNPDTMNIARNKLFKLYWVHRLTQLMSLFVLLKILKSVSKGRR